MVGRPNAEAGRKEIRIMVEQEEQDMKTISEGKYHYKGMLITRKEKKTPYLNRNGKLKTAKETFWAVYEMGNFIGSADTLEKAKKIIEEVQDET